MRILKSTNLMIVGVVVLFAIGIVVNPSYARIDPDTLVGMWLFEEGAGNTVKDSSGKGNDGTIDGPEWVKGKYGSGLQFNGEDNWMGVADSESLDISDKITIVAWVQFFSVSPWTILKKDHAYSMQGGGDGPKMRCLLHKEGWVDLEFYTEEELKVGEWYHLAFTYDGSKMRMYINGEEDKASPLAHDGGMDVNDNTVGVGIWWKEEDAAPHVGAAFNGVMDELAVFHEALTKADIQKVMNGLEQFMSVEAKNKLVTTWGSIKAQR